MGNAMAQPLIGRSLLQLPVTRGGTRGQPSDMELKQADSMPEDYSFGPKLKNHGSVDNQMWQLQRSVLKSWKTKDSTYIESGNDSGRQAGVLYALVNIRRDSVKLENIGHDSFRLSCLCDALKNVTLDTGTTSPSVAIISLTLPQTINEASPSSTSINLPAGYGQHIEILFRLKKSEDSDSGTNARSPVHQDLSTAGNPDSGMGFEDSEYNVPGAFIFLRALVSVEEDIKQEHVTRFSILTDSPKGCQVVVDTQEIILNGLRLIYTPLYGGSTEMRSDAPADYSECVVCLSEPKSATLLPCQHLSLCKSCAFVLKMQHNFQNRKCPVCRTAIYSILVLDT